MSWLARPLACDGAVCLNALDPERLTDADLYSICFRMHVILDTIEMPRCEGRLIPAGLFDRMDSLESLVLHGGSPRLPEWAGLIREFGEYYGLAGSEPIAVDPGIYREIAVRYRILPGEDSR